ncbi:ribosomal protein L7/L12, partial [Salmonella enterica subsp. enterica serovar Istanbul]|nr:ribosomal protein L7/L12 [Salmonella enterica subsp. enterica serovar Istanbul]
DAKGLVDADPKVIKEGLSEDDANKIKEQLEEVGATVTLK